MNTYADAIREIATLAKATQIPVITPYDSAPPFTTAPIQPIYRPEDMPPKPVQFTTLKALVNFYKTGEIPDSDNMCQIHVTAYNEAKLVGRPCPQIGNNRPVYATATNSMKPFHFGSYHPLEDFIIALMSLFVQDDTVDDILSTLGNLASEQIAENKDDRFSQTLHIRSSLTTKTAKPVENPVPLRPFRTFSEIEQPLCTCLIRYKNTDTGIACGLWEADGGRWRETAVRSITDFLEPISGIPVIG